MEEKFHDNYVRLQEKLQEKLVRKKNMMNQMHKDDMDDVKIEAKIKQYITGAVLPNLNPDSPEDEKWGNELRKVCVMFVNLGIKEQQLLAAARYEEAMKDVHEVLCEVQKSVYQYEGAINKFLMDDKGSTLIACFGLPPGAHEDDCERGEIFAKSQTRKDCTTKKILTHAPPPTPRHRCPRRAQGLREAVRPRSVCVLRVNLRRGLLRNHRKQSEEGVHGPR